MAQAGIHALLGTLMRNRVQKRELLLLGLILGNLIPDLDNLAVAAATLNGRPTEGLHRTFTHSFFTALGIGVLLYVVGWVLKKPEWGNLGLGLGAGIVMHILVDLLIWFNGVEIFWPLPSWVNLWENVTPPEWWSKLMMPMEFLFMAFFLGLLGNWARKTGTDQDYLPKLRIWVSLLVGLFVLFTGMVYMLDSGFLVPFGALYLVVLGLVIGVTIRMRATIESAGT